MSDVVDHVGIRVGDGDADSVTRGTYHAAFLLDPDCNNVEAVFHKG